MTDAFESWIGQEVVVQLGFGLFKVSLRGVLLQDLRETLLLKPKAGLNIEIVKTKVLAIEEVEQSPQGPSAVCASRQPYPEFAQSRRLDSNEKRVRGRQLV